MIELYAILRSEGPPLPEIAPLRTVACDGLAAVCGPATAGPVSPDELWRHEEVVEALMERRDLLPVRYGTRLDDDASAVRALRDRHDQFAAALERVRGAVELSVRVLAAEPPAAEAEVSSGSDYLRAKALSAATSDEIHEPLAGLARTSVQRNPGSPGELLRAAYLVDRRRVETFVERVAALQEAHADLRLLCTGPWPPYSFAEQ